MGKKLSYEEVQADFEREGYTLLSQEYLGNNSKLDFICSNGHTHSIWSYDWLRGVRCGKCKGHIEVTYDQIKASFDNEGYILHTTNYVNNMTLFNYSCTSGHTRTTNWKKWHRGVRCAICSHKSTKYTYEEVCIIFKECNYRLLSKEYVNASTKLTYICANGHQHTMTLNKFLYGQRCPTCFTLSNIGEGNPNWKGGKSFENYCPIWYNKDYKTDIKNRDNNICQNPYCFNIDSVLHIHHIDYDKKNCHPSNLITICRTCNARANKDRDWHKEWYQTIMSKRFNYNIKEH